jgi:hypothetical protein
MDSPLVDSPDPNPGSIRQARHVLKVGIHLVRRAEQELLVSDPEDPGGKHHQYRHNE